MITCSTDSEFTHLAWKREDKNLADSPFIWLADTNHDLSKALGILHPKGISYRATFLIDPNGEIQHVSVNNLDVGRNPAETLRILADLQT